MSSPKYMFTSLIFQSLLWLAVSASNNFFSQNLDIQCSDRNRADSISQEFQIAYFILGVTIAYLNTDDPYYKAFFMPVVSDGDVELLKGTILPALQSITLSDVTDYTLRVTCDEDDTCIRGRSTGTTAWTSQSRKQMNLCNSWFSLANTKDFQCLGRNFPLEYYLSKALVLIHELTHTGYQDENGAKYEDIAYGVQDCVKLAKGELLDANGRPLPAEDCTQNADSYAWLSYGIYWSNVCRFQIPLKGPSSRIKYTENADVGQYTFKLPISLKIKV